MSKNYTVYHLHDDTGNGNGYADSCTKYDEYIKLAKENNMKAIAFSNHGSIYDWIKKKLSCEKAGIKYIHGVETYLCINLQDNTRGYHIGLYAKNHKGVIELNQLISKSTSKGVKDDNSDRHMYYNPRISFEELFNTSDNIMVTSACLASALWKLSDINNENYDYCIEKRDELLNWMSKNNHRCFLEIQYHNCEHQKQYNKMLYDWSREYNLRLIAGTDTHSSTKYKAECRKVLQKSKNSFYGEEDEFDLIWKTYDELISCFMEQNSLDYDVIIEAIENTNIFADMVEDFKLDRSFKYPTLYGDDADIKWRDFILKCFKEKIKNGEIDKSRIGEYKKVIREEYEIMVKQGMSSFMLFMGELMNWCIEQDIHVSPCRGSVGGSLIASITRITDVDPLVWNTVFSRFCNADRISLADIDVDFSPKDRGRVYEYIINRFGSDKVSYILTLGTIKDRGSIDVLAKGLDYSNLKLVAEIKDRFDTIFKEYTKIIQEEVNLEELENAESKSPDFVDHELYIKTINNKDAVNKIEYLKKQWDGLRLENEDLFYYFDGIKGTIISKGIHPAGMIGSPITLADNLGVIYRDGDTDKPVSTCTMKAVDFMNYVKFDILGLKTIGIIQDTYKLIGKRWEFAHEIDWNDSNVWDDMVKLNSGVFQFEGSYAHDLLSEFKPQTINDMSLTNAALRPSGKSYRNRLMSRQINPNPSEQIDELLRDNKGYLVFQEDTIKFLTDICGFDGSLADTTRRAIGKKDKEQLNEQLPKILEGYCKMSNKNSDVAKQEAMEFIQIISDSSEYQFGYNHSTGYSMNGYMATRLRCYYPLEFTTSYLNWCENDDDLQNAHKLLKEYKITLHNPKFRYSKVEYYMDKKTNSIFKGVESIKYLNKQVGECLYSLKNKQYTSFIELLKDIKGIVDNRQLTILIELDYFSEFGKSQKLINIVELYNNIYTKKQFNKEKELPCDLEILRKYAKIETEKMLKDIDKEGLCKEIESTLKDLDLPIQRRMQSWIENTGSCNLQDKTQPKNKAIVIDINTKYKTPKVKLYNLYSGKTAEVKIGAKNWREDKLELFDLIEILSTKPKFKKKKVNEEWISTDEKEFWLENYIICNK